jgi:hypothetical protein
MLDERRLAFTTNSKGIVTSVSNSPASLFGFDPQALVGCHVSTIIDILRPTDNDNTRNHGPDEEEEAANKLLMRMAELSYSTPGMSWRVGVSAVVDPIAMQALGSLGYAMISKRTVRSRRNEAYGWVGRKVWCRAGLLYDSSTCVTMTECGIHIQTMLQIAAAMTVEGHLEPPVLEGTRVVDVGEMQLKLQLWRSDLLAGVIELDAQGNVASLGLKDQATFNPHLLLGTPPSMLQGAQNVLLSMAAREQPLAPIRAHMNAPCLDGTITPNDDKLRRAYAGRSFTTRAFKLHCLKVNGSFMLMCAWHAAGTPFSHIVPLQGKPLLEALFKEGALSTPKAAAGKGSFKGTRGGLRNGGQYSRKRGMGPVHTVDWLHGTDHTELVVTMQALVKQDIGSGCSVYILLHVPQPAAGRPDFSTWLWDSPPASLPNPKRQFIRSASSISFVETKIEPVAGIVKKAGFLDAPPPLRVRAPAAYSGVQSVGAALGRRPNNSPASESESESTSTATSSYEVQVVSLVTAAVK